MRIGPLRGVAVAALAFQLTGCSLMFVERAPPNVPRGAWVACTESKVWPVVDTVWGVTTIAGSFGISAAADRADSPSERTGAQFGAVLYGLAGVGLLYSAYVGFRETNRCSQIREDAAAHGVYGPQPYYPYPPPQPYPPQPYPPQPYPPPGQPYPPPHPHPQPPPTPQLQP